MPDGQPRRVVDCTFAKQFLGFENRISLEDGIGDMVNWYIDNVT